MITVTINTTINIMIPIMVATIVATKGTKYPGMAMNGPVKLIAALINATYTAACTIENTNESMLLTIS